ncbi:MAG: hypothetical protein V7L05_24105 [Nostoc sp.]|uniref:hypothetical protein n=1 Tax=Nostoc sp. TaxID=1180 RepID=UPI002FF465A1
MISIENRFIRGLLCGCIPAEITNVGYQSRSSSTVRVYLYISYRFISDRQSNNFIWLRDRCKTPYF